MDKGPKVLLIINPIAGTSRKEGLDRLVTSRLEALGWSVDVKFTQGPADATRLAREAVDLKYDAVIAAGGDGTVNEIATDLCDTGVTLGIIPCGSGNGLARHLNIPVDVLESLLVIEKNHPVNIDYGMLGDKHFFCTCGMGFDAAVSHKFASQPKRGFSTYVKSAFSEYLHYKPHEYTISVDGEIVTERAFVIAVCNASQYGNNAYIAPDAKIDDGLLDVTVIHAASPLRTVFVGLDMMTGYINHNTLISNYRVKETVIHRDQDGPIHIDGEPMTMEGPLTIKCNHNGLRVFTPLVSKPFKPVITPVNSMLHSMRLSISHLIH